MSEAKAEIKKREERKKIEALRPMSRLEFQILYGKCASSGWVYGEFNETLYQQYLQRYGFFLCHLTLLKTDRKIFEDVLLTQLPDKDIFFLVDKSGLIHTISLPGAKAAKAVNEANEAKAANINWFFAESPNTLETYVYNPDKKTETAYYTGPLTILKEAAVTAAKELMDPAKKAATLVVPTTTQKQNWINQNIILLDFFPFPIIMSTDIRKDVMKEGYTFRKHLSEYFKPLVENVKKLFDSPTAPASVNVYLIAPTYTSVHAILELTDFEWAELVTLNASSTYKKSNLEYPFGFDKKNTPLKIYDGHIEIRNNEFNEFSNKFSLTTPTSPEINPHIPSPESNYDKFCSYLKNKIYLNDGNVPGITGVDE